MTTEREEAGKVSDTRGPGGPKTKDSSRAQKSDNQKNTRDLRSEPMDAEERAGRSSEEVNAMCTDASIEGANQHLHDVTQGHVFGDTTSSTGGANNPGQHGRDGGEVNGEDSNPAPEPPEVPEGEPAPEVGSAGDEAGTQTDLGLKKENEQKEPEVKKL